MSTQENARCCDCARLRAAETEMQEQARLNEMCAERGLELMVRLEEAEKALKAAVKKEREKCAQVCLTLAKEYISGIESIGDRAHGKVVAANSCASAILALGDK